MERHIAIDTGKYATKVSEYLANDGKIRTFSMRTRVSEGDMRDDALEKHTVLMQYGDKTYKVGDGARGNGAGLDTDKKTDIHRIAVLTALATLASNNETDDIFVAIGLPAKDWANVGKRVEFKQYMFPTEGTDAVIKVLFKPNSKTDPIEKQFRIRKAFVYPESLGALFMDSVIENVNTDSLYGVIDIGRLNVNATMWSGTDLLQDRSTTADCGGAMLVQELSQELSANVVPCDELLAAKILKAGTFSVGKNLPEEKIKAGNEVLQNVKKNHAEKVRKIVRSREWPIDILDILAIGGTTELIADELSDAFGGNITILNNTSFCNSLGYLRLLCAQDGLNTVIPLVLQEPKEKTRADEKTENADAPKPVKKENAA